MQPGQTIAIQLVDTSGAPLHLAGVVPEIAFFFQGRTERPLYTFDGFATDDQGASDIDFSEIEAQRQLLRSASLMDYNVALTDCDPTVEVRIPPERDFEERRQRIWHRSWWRPTWISEWPSNGRLAPVKPVRTRVEGRFTRVEIPVTVGSI